MESASKADLLSTVSKQTEQLKRYESRLRDVVAAYKGLTKQKEALETSLAALNKSKEGDEDDSVAKLTVSLATLVAEKSRMEEAFQIDKKASIENHERALRELQDQAQAKIQQHRAEVENLKAKLAFERQEREKERFSHNAILKELQQKINSERRSKEKLEDTILISADTSDAAQDLEKRVRDLNNELEATQRKLNRAEARTVETPQMLVKLQEKIAMLQQGHTLALREEQIKAKRAEETARKVCASQEERVAILEAKLNELSQTVGEYDLQSRRDQQLIQKLRQSFNDQLLERHEDQNSKGESGSAHSVLTSETDAEKLADTEYFQNLLDKVHLLKKELIAENERLGSPIKLSSIFSDGKNSENVHAACQAELQAVKTEYELHKLQLSQNKVGNGASKSYNKDDVAMLKSRIRLLQDKIEYMNKHLEDVKEQYDDKLKHQEETYKQAVSHQQNVTSELKGRIMTLEKQLQAQRSRYTVLLEEREDYLRSRNDRSRKVSMEEDFQGSMQEASAPPHMLHYAQELARKDLDISTLRKEKHILDGQLRDCQRDNTIEKEHYKELIKSLKDEVKRLHRIQSREGANLEYLKNVVLSYLLSSDYAGKRHMLNAISAVLNFTDAEKNSVYKLL